MRMDGYPTYPRYQREEISTSSNCASSATAVPDRGEPVDAGKVYNKSGNESRVADRSDIAAPPGGSQLCDDEYQKLGPP